MDVKQFVRQLAIFRSRREIAFEQIATEAAIDQVVVAIVAPGDYGKKVIYGQITARVGLGYATVPGRQPPNAPGPDRASDAARRLLLGTKKLPGLRHKSTFEGGDFRLEVVDVAVDK